MILLVLGSMIPVVGLLAVITFVAGLILSIAGHFDRRMADQTGTKDQSRLRAIG